MHTNYANKELIYKDLSYQLNGIFFEVHNELGRFMSERQYADAIEKRLKLRGIVYKRECLVGGEEIKGNRVDFLVEDKILIDVKAKRLVSKEDYYQMLRYLKAGKFQLGLIVNFRNTYIKPRRIANSFM